MEIKKYRRDSVGAYRDESGTELGTANLVITIGKVKINKKNVALKRKKKLE